MSSRLASIIGAVFSAVGLVLVCVGGAIAYSTYSFVVSAERANGTVVGIDVEETTRTRDGVPRTDHAEYPVVEFEADGEVRTFRSNLSTSDNPVVGEAVTVLFDPADPDDARLDSGLLNHLPDLIIAGVGLAFVVVGSVMLVDGRRRRRRAGPPVDAPIWTEDAVG